MSIYIHTMKAWNTGNPFGSGVNIDLKFSLLCQDVKKHFVPPSSVMSGLGWMDPGTTKGVESHQFLWRGSQSHDSSQRCRCFIFCMFFLQDICIYTNIYSSVYLFQSCYSFIFQFKFLYDIWWRKRVRRPIFTRRLGVLMDDPMSIFWMAFEDVKDGPWREKLRVWL